MIYVLLTGGAGFIGSSLAEKLLEHPDIFLVIADNLTTGSIQKVPQHPRCVFKKIDVNNFEEIASLFYYYPFEYVFHYAATVGVQRTLQNPIKVLNDLHGIENILRISRCARVKRIFFSSSSEVYGEPVEFPQNEETTPLNSRLPYAIVKNASEAFLKAYYKEYGLRYTIFRFFNTYGPKQSTDFVISRFINLALKNEPLTIHGDGSQTRTFCYIDDNVDATYNVFLSVLKNPNTDNHIINIGNDSEISILDLAKLIIRLTNSASSLKFLPPLPEGDMTRRLPDITKMKEFLQRPLISLEQGINYILENPIFILNM
ncbi:MAG: NAD-dependent epimerase/dehydratase family protein [Bacteroidales bacterium]|nr:NAD-dependent epimerase/dehydratase family protein [Bacteroidales bacterium]